MGKVIDLLSFFETAKNRPRVSPEAASAIMERVLEIDTSAEHIKGELGRLIPQPPVAPAVQPEAVETPLSETHASEVADLATERARRAVENAHLFGAMEDYDQAA